MSGSCRRVRRAFVVVAVTVGAWAGASSAARAEPAPAAEAERAAWVPVEATGVVSWPEKPWIADGGASETLRADQWLVVPARPGDRVRFRAEPGLRVETGLATSRGRWLTSIAHGVGQHASEGAFEVAVPRWSASHAVVARIAGSGGQIDAEIAAPPRDAAAWARFVDGVYAWIEDGDGEAPAAPTAEAEQLVRFLSAVREALGERGRRSDVIAWMTAVAVESSLAQRPLSAPWFAGAEPAVTGGKATAVPGVARDTWRDADFHEIVAGGAVRFDPDQAEVVQIAVSPDASQITELEVLRAGVSLRRVVLGVAGGARLATLRAAIPPAGGDVEIRAVRGRAAVAVRLHTQRPASTGAPRLDGALRALAREAGPLSAWAQAFRKPQGASEALLRPVPASEAQAKLLHSVLSVEAVRWASPDRARAVGDAAWLATQGLVDSLRVPLQLRLLTMLSARGNLGPEIGVPVGGALSLALDDLPAGIADGVAVADVEAARALAASLAPRRDGARPLDAARASAFAATDAAGAVHGRFARRAWLGEAGYRAVSIRGDAEPVQVVSPVPTSAAGQRCSAAGPTVHWSSFGPGTHSIDVSSAEPGTHQIVSLRAERAVSVQIDGVTIPVHATRTATSSVAVRPGPRSLVVPAGGSVLARVPRSGDVECGSLRDVQRWFEAEGSVWIDVPGGGVETSVRVEVSALPGSNAPARLEATSGQVRGETWAAGDRPAILELPVSAAVGRIELRLPQRARVRALARMRAHAPGSKARATSDDAIRDALRRVARASAALAGEVEPAARRHWWLHRAQALTALGYTRYADLDRSRAGAGMPGSGGGLASAVAPPVLPDTAADVVPVNVAASVALTASEPLAEAMAAEGRGDAAVAARAYRALAEAHDSVPLAVRAARRIADHALAERDGRGALEAYAWAKRAESRGADVSGLIARLAPSIQWVRARSADGGAGGQWVDSEPPKAEDAPLPSRVRRAYLAAPDDSILVAEGRAMTARVSYAQPTSMWLDARCVDVAPVEPVEACRVVVSVDGREVETKPTGGGRRVFELPSGAHRIDVTNEPADTAIAWVRLARVGDEQPLPSRVRSKWLVSKPRQPTQLTFAGPTVLRVTARPEAGEPGEVVVEVDGRRSDTLKLSASEGRAVMEIAVLASGSHRLRLTPDRGSVLVRVHLAGHGEVPEAAAPKADTSSSEVGWVPLEDHADGFATLSLRLRGVARFTEDDDDARRDAGSYFESELALRRELLPRAGYLYVAGLLRPRDGPVSYGGRARLDLGAGLWPRLYAKGQLVAQDLGGGALGTKIAGAVHWRAPVSSSVSIGPLVGIDWRDLAAPPVGSGSDADPDVFSAFDAARPRSLFGSLSGTWRPTIDAAFRIRGGLRTNEFVEEVDRVHVTPAIFLAPGRGLAPIASASYTASYRLAGDTRSQSFLRHLVGVGLELFGWAGGGHRISITTRGRMAVVSTPQFSGWAGLGWDFAPGRGARDFAPHEVPFRHRLEEGSDRVVRAASREPQWGDEEEGP